MRLRLERPGVALLAFMVSFAVCIVAGQIAIRVVPALGAAQRRAATIRYPDSSWYFVANTGTQLDHYVLFHGFGSSMHAAREADIIVLGNSRTQFGLPSERLRVFEKRHGVKVFHLGLGFFEAYSFPLEIIRKFDLRPKLVIVNADGFFAEGESVLAKEVRETPRWKAAKTVYENLASSVVMPWLTAVFPLFVKPPLSSYVLRSSTHGSWRPVDWPHYDTPFRDTPLPFEVGNVLPGAQRFKAEMDRRGTQIILTCIPGEPEVCTPAVTVELAKALDVAAIVPWPRHLKIGDGSHLCPASGRRFARAFLDQLARSPELRAIARR